MDCERCKELREYCNQVIWILQKEREYNLQLKDALVNFIGDKTGYDGKMATFLKINEHV